MHLISNHPSIFKNNGYVYSSFPRDFGGNDPHVLSILYINGDHVNPGFSLLSIQQQESNVIQLKARYFFSGFLPLDVSYYNIKYIT